MKLILVLVFVTGCASQPKLHDPYEFSSNECQLRFRENMEKDTDSQLDHASDLFQQHCFKETIQIAEYIRKQHRDKYYSMSAEVAEVFVPEGSFTPYVLESYERSFLSLLAAASHLQLGQQEKALVELRRTVDEENARLYNHGEDPVISFLLAALWDRFDPSLSRPHWQALEGQPDVEPTVKAFAKKRIAAIDRAENSRVSWRISSVGNFPALDWHSQFFTSKPYKIVSLSPFPNACVGPTALLVPTEPWLRKLSTRHNSDYHPLMYTKSLVRFPVGVAYGAVLASAGVGVGVGGCVADAQAKGSNGDLCKASLNAAGKLLSASSSLVEFTLRPDMRHWKKVPIAFLIESEGDSDKVIDCPQLDTLSLPRHTLVN